MKKYILITLIGAFSWFSMAQNNIDPWNDSQLYSPKKLAMQITANQTDDLLILCIGYQPIIPGSVNMGPATNTENLSKLKAYLKNVDRSKEVIIYCGCCPFEKCPNVRPAFQLLKEMGFKNPRLLNIPDNIKTDWLDKGYPANEK